jgi:hypothetical protein
VERSSPASESIPSRHSGAQDSPLGAYVLPGGDREVLVSSSKVDIVGAP